jgi:hypothetical protein
MYAIGISDDCVVGGNRVGALPTAWVAILAGLVNGQLRLEHNDKNKQGQQGSSRSGAVFCCFPLPVAREAVLEDHLGGAVAGVLETCFAWAWRLAAAIAKLKAAGGCCPSSLWFV